MTFQRFCFAVLALALTGVIASDSFAGTRHSRGRSRPIFSSSRPYLFSSTDSESAARHGVASTNHVPVANCCVPAATCCAPAANVVTSSHTACNPAMTLASGFAKP